jgi:hypothetical protein
VAEAKGEELSMRRVCVSGSLVLAVGVALWSCAIDDRSPTEAMAPNQPLVGGAAGTSPEATATPKPGMGEGEGGAGNGARAAGASGSAGSSPGVRTGNPPGAGGMANVGAAGSSPVPASAGATGMGTSGAAGSPPLVPPVDGDAPTVSSNCPAFSACGGELAGSWAYIDVCPESPVGLLMALCPTGSVQFDPGGASALSFSNGQVARSGVPLGDSVLTLPLDCENVASCASVGATLGGVAECSETASDCICRTPSSIPWSQQSYTVSGTQLTLADGRTFDYCVAADRLTYRETGDRKEPGIFTLERN